MSGCPYEKVYFNHRTGKAGKCTFCFPSIEAGMPTICSETCVGRLRYPGLMLYDADRVLAAAATTDPAGLHEAQLSVFLDPDDPAVAAEAIVGSETAEAVRLSDGTVLPATVVVGVGVVPRVELAEAVDLAVDNGVVVDEHLATSAPGIFAAGDVANAFHPGSGGELVSFWLRRGRVAAAMNANVWDAGDAIEALLQVDWPIDPALLADPEVDLAGLTGPLGA